MYKTLPSAQKEEVEATMSSHSPILMAATTMEELRNPSHSTGFV